MNKILVPTGYMGSGSSAVTDIAEIDGCSARNGDFEFVFLHCPNGVFDLEDKLLHGNNAIRKATKRRTAFRHDEAAVHEKILVGRAL